MDPAEEKREMKRKIEYFNMLGYVVDSEYGIPQRCLCGGRIIDEVGGKEENDTLLGKRFFTCKNFQADGLYYRQPWVFGVQEEIERLNKRVKEAEQRVSEAEQVMYMVRNLNNQLDTLEAHVYNFNVKITEMEKKIKGLPGLV